MKLQLVKRLAQVYFLGAVAAAGVAGFIHFDYFQNTRKPAEVLQKAPEVISQVEHHTGMSTGEPAVDFINITTDVSSMAITGLFDDDENKVYLNYSIRWKFEEDSPPLSVRFLQYLGSPIQLAPPLNLEETLVHEVGHAVMNHQKNVLLRRGLKIPSIVYEEKKELSAEEKLDVFIANRYVGEGFAETLTKDILGMPSEDCDWQLAHSRLKAEDDVIGIYRDFYRCGHALVAPIVKKIGYEESASRLLFDPPRFADLKNIGAYHERIMATDWQPRE